MLNVTLFVKPFLALICLGLGNLLALCTLVCILWLSYLSPLELSQIPVLYLFKPSVDFWSWSLDMFGLCLVQKKSKNMSGKKINLLFFTSTVASSLERVFSVDWIHGGHPKWPMFQSDLQRILFNFRTQSKKQWYSTYTLKVKLFRTRIHACAAPRALSDVLNPGP